MSDTLILTARQEQAVSLGIRLSQLARRGDSNVPKGIVVGYAGTGKTTALRAIAAAVGRETDALVITPTGKAALRVTEATGLPAMTCHRWCFAPFLDQKTGKVRFERKSPTVIPPSRLVLVDEGSMIDEEVWNSLIQGASEAECAVLVCGDGFQLPPVRKHGSLPFCALDVPAIGRVELDMIHRQRKGSYIIEASLALREARVADVRLPRTDTAFFFNAAEEILESNGAILCYRNVTRQHCNAIIRARRRLPANDPQAGEPLLVQKNLYHDVCLYNGEQTTFHGWTLPPTPCNVWDKYADREWSLNFGLASVNAGERRSGATVEVVLILEDLLGVSPLPVDAVLQGAAFNWAIDTAPEHQRLEKVWMRTDSGIESSKILRPPPLLRANFGYVLTVHKAQGSQWNRILVALEPMVCLNEERGRRWLYTAITRAADDCSISMVSSSWPVTENRVSP